MFKRAHHNHVAIILQALNGELLAQHQCFFGGGTAIVLTHDEYRESIDIDFLISNHSGYQSLRSLFTERSGLTPILRPGMELSLARNVRKDQYGIRTMIRIADSEIKFEIIFEGRVQLEIPIEKNRICGVYHLSPLDMAVSKLLANSDRWSDGSVFNRDLIDLAMLRLPSKTMKLAIAKAKEAYGESVERDLVKATQSLSKRKGRLDECMTQLKMTEIPKALLWKYIRDLIKA